MEHIHRIAFAIFLILAGPIQAHAYISTGQEDFQFAVMGGPLLDKPENPQETFPLDTQPADAKTKLKVENAFAKMPLRFEKNEGQTSDDVKFLSRGQGYTMYFTPTESVMVRTKTIDSGKPKGDHFDPMADLEPPETETSVVRMEVIGANPQADIRGEEPLPGTSNYFLGNDQSKWQQGVRNYKKIHYEEVYPGIDLVYYGNQRKLEYDFIVKPGADPNQITLNFEGVDGITLKDNGDLLLRTQIGEVIHQTPIIYQTIAGEKKPIEGSYSLMADNSVAFNLAEYDSSHDLVIDPLAYSSYLGTRGTDEDPGIAVDSFGNVYVIGRTTRAFETLNALEEFSGSMFVLKLEDNDNVPSLVWSTFLDGSLSYFGNGIAVDKSGNVYVTGSTSSSDFYTLNSIEDFNGNRDVFVVKIEETDNVPSLAYSTLLGGSDGDTGIDIAVDNSGNVYVMGQPGSDFDTLNAIEGDSGLDDVFVFKLEENNNVPSLAWSTYLGGSDRDLGRGIAVDNLGNVYVTGETDSTDFDIKNAIVDHNRFRDVFVFKLEQQDNVPTLAWSTYLGGNNWDYSSDIAVDNFGNIYLTGFTDSAHFNTLNAIEGDSGITDIFVTKIEQQDNVPTLAWSTYLGGKDRDYGRGIAVDNSGNVYVTGNSHGGFDTTVGGCGKSAFVLKLDQKDNIPSLGFSTCNIPFRKGDNIAVDNQGIVYIVGEDNFKISNASNGDIGLSKYYIPSLVSGET